MGSDRWFESQEDLQNKRIEEIVAERTAKYSKALELWKRLFERMDSPRMYTEPDGETNYQEEYCIFCGSHEAHYSDCIWIEAKKLVQENE